MSPSFGARSVAMVDVLDKSWFTSPMNECRSVRLEGFGNLAVACVMDGSIRYPSEERWKQPGMRSKVRKFWL